MMHMLKKIQYNSPPISGVLVKTSFPLLEVKVGLHTVEDIQEKTKLTYQKRRLQ